MKARGERCVDLGRVVATRGAVFSLTEDEILSALQRHRRGDWGEVSAEDARANDRALREGARLLSAYRTASGVRHWVITEANRKVTTVLLPEEY